jgi:uncharacterized membrane protein YagU involved in acid resistance
MMQMKDKKFIVIGFFVTLFCWFITGLTYSYIFFRYYDEVFVRNIYHFYSAILLAFVYTFIATSVNNRTIKKSDIKYGIIGVIFLTVFWEIIVQGASRYVNAQVFFLQYDQIFSDILGIAVFSVIWCIYSRIYKFKNNG